MSMMQLQLNETTSVRRRIPFFCMDDDAASEFAPRTGLTFAAGELQLSKNGATEVAFTGTVGEIGGGWYYYEAVASEMDTEGFLTVRPAKADVYSSGTVVQLVAYDPYSSTDLGLSTLATNLDTTVSSRLPTSSYEGLDGLLDATDAIETGMTLRQALRLIASVLGGDVAGAGTGTEYFRAAVANHKVRVTSAATRAGDRTVVADLD